MSVCIMGLKCLLILIYVFKDATLCRQKAYIYNLLHLYIVPYHLPLDFSERAFLGVLLMILSNLGGFCRYGNLTAVSL